MNLRQLHETPQAMAEILGIPFEPEIVVHTCWNYRRSTETYVRSPEERVGLAYADYRKQLQADWNKSADNPFKAQNWSQFIGECLRESLGIKSKGTLTARIAQAIASRPDLYPAD